MANLIDERVDPQLESTLAISVDEMSWDDLNDGHYDWPTPQRVKEYRDKTRAIVDDFIRNCDLTLPINWEDPMWIIMMGIEHERIHLETSSVLIRELPLAMVKAHPYWSNISAESGKGSYNTLLPVQGGQVSIGKPKNDPLYGWDVEYGQLTTNVPDFKASKYLVSNGEFLEFIDDGGYQ